MEETLAFFIDRLLAIGSPKPACADEVCVIEWVINQTCNAQSIYDGAQDAALAPEDLQKVEELLKHTLEKIRDTGLSSLGVLEV